MSHVTVQNHDDEEFVDQVYDVIDEETGTDFMDNEGVGLYKTQSMINHSCRPNAKIHFLSDSNELTGYYGVLILRVSLFFINWQN